MDLIPAAASCGGIASKSKQQSFFTENVINANRYSIIMANNFVSFDMGPYNIQFNAERYDLKRKDDYSVIAKASGSSGQMATISIWPNDEPPLLSTDDGRLIVRDTGLMARWAEPGLPSSSIAAFPTAKNIYGHDGFYVRISYGNVPKTTASCERVFCSLDDGYMLNILSIYPVNSHEEPKLTLIEDVVSSILNIHTIRQ